MDYFLHRGFSLNKNLCIVLDNKKELQVQLKTNNIFSYLVPLPTSINLQKVLENKRYQGRKDNTSYFVSPYFLN